MLLSYGLKIHNLFLLFIKQDLGISGLMFYPLTYIVQSYTNKFVYTGNFMSRQDV